MSTQDLGPSTMTPPPDPSTPPAAPAAGGHRGRNVLMGVVAVVAAGAVATAGTLYLTSDDRRTATAGGTRAGTSQPVTGPAAAPAVDVAGLTATGAVPWQGPLRVSVTSGTLTAVTATAPDGTALTGSVGADGAWTAPTGLAPSTTYAVVVTARDTAGQTRTLPLAATTTPPDKTFTVSITPGDGTVVGVGQAVSVRLSTPVKDQAARAQVEKRLSVTTAPAVVGAWRWMSSTELRYRGADLWAPGTTIAVATKGMTGVQAAAGVWGSADRTTRFTVGDALTSVVDVTAHTMTVSKNGVVQKVMKASMGKPGFDTRNGTFVVLEKSADKIMDSSTVDLPPGTPAYKTAVKDAVRITNSGTFTHGAPWSVASQGVRNVSHGCVNLSPADAHWYFLQAKRGDVVTVVNSTVAPKLTDAGSQDWNLTFDQWKSGSALA